MTNRSSKPRILVTGAGSGVGQGIVRSLEGYSDSIELVIADISREHAAMHWGFPTVCIPRLEEPGATDKFIKLVLDNDIDLVLPGSEYDILPLARIADLVRLHTSAQVVVSPQETVELSNDKWCFAEHLHSHGIPAPFTVRGDEPGALELMVEMFGFPLVVKPRFGTASRGVNIVESMEQSAAVLGSSELPIIQELLVGNDPEQSSEYTCSVFRSPSGELVGPFCAKRTLRGGVSWKVQVEPFEELHPYLLSVAESVDFLGSLNIQLILGSNGPQAFEMNCRFSGTTGIRAHFGFNEPWMAVESFLYRERLPLPTITQGIVYRYVENTFVSV